MSLWNPPRRAAHLRGLFAAISVFLCANCGSASTSDLKRLIPREHDRLARKTIAAVHARRFRDVHKTLARGLRRTRGVDDSLWKASAYLPEGEIDTLRLVGVDVVSRDKVTRSRLTYEVHTAHGWGAVYVIVAEDLRLRYIEGFRTYSLAASLEEINAFTWRGKGTAHVLVLLLLVGCVGTSLAGVVVAIRTPMPRRWLWALFASFGAMRLTFNWTTAQVGFDLLYVQFLCAAAVRFSGADPWLIGVSFPVGAIAVFNRVRQIRRANTNAEPQPNPQPPTSNLQP